MDAIEAEDLVKTYPGNVRALDGLTFSVPEGTIFGLLGPNGAGKTTAVKILTTLSRADSGTARVANLDVRRDAARVRRGIGVVQQKHGVDVALTGRENLRLQGRIFGMRGREIEERVQHLLEQVGLDEAADRVARGYSGGMQRRLDIAMALVHRPRVLFLDEPTTGLDPEVRVAMWQEIEQLRGAEHLTILLTTHYLEEADRLVSNLAIVERGARRRGGHAGEAQGRASRRLRSRRARRRRARRRANRARGRRGRARGDDGRARRSERGSITAHVPYRSSSRRSKHAACRRSR